MANPRRVDADDFFAQLLDHQRPHLALLRELSLGADQRIEEALHWNQPAYVLDGKRQWVLQAYQQHCSLRFPTRFFADHVAEVFKVPAVLQLRGAMFVGGELALNRHRGDRLQDPQLTL